MDALLGRDLDIPGIRQAAKRAPELFGARAPAPPRVPGARARHALVDEAEQLGAQHRLRYRMGGMV